MGIKVRKLINLTLYKGSEWWSLSREFIKYIRQYLMEHPEYERRFKHTNCCDEIFFHMLIMNSPLRDLVVKDNLRYIDWEDRGRGSLPNVLMKEDYDRIKNKRNALFMRKIDPIKSKEQIDLFRFQNE